MALCLTTSLFAHELVFLWTGNRLTTLDVVPPLRLLAVAAAVQGLLVLPFQVQMAYGWTSLSIKTSLTVLALTAPVTILASVHYGAMGAAAASISFNVVYAARYIPKMHRRILVGELRPWFVHDVMFPVAGALAAVFVARTLWPHDTGRWLNAPVLIAAGSFVLVCSALAGANLRQYLRGRLARLRTSLSS
jgi:O-antigen/teichoic acid export membrane protein